MCIKAGNLSNISTSGSSCTVKEVICDKSFNSQAQKSEKLLKSEEVDSWEQLLDTPDQQCEISSSDQPLSKEISLQEERLSKISLNSEIQQTDTLNILEISNMPSTIREEDIYKAFNVNSDQMTIKWMNRTKVQLIFPSEEAAINAYFSYLSSSFSIGSLSPLVPGYHSIYSSVSSAFTSSTKTPLTVFHKSAFLATLEPSKDSLPDKRPAKTATVAKRLIAGVLGVRAPRTTKEKAYDEMMIRQFLDTLKEKEELEQRKERIWEIGF